MTASDGTPTDRYALRLALIKKEVPADLKLTPYIRLLLSSLDYRSNPEHLSILQTFVAADPDLLKQVLEQDPNGPAPPPRRIGKDDTIHVPTLPKEAQLTAHAVELALSAGNGLDEIIAWLTKRASMSPRLFLEAAALWVVALVIASRLTLKLDFEAIKPNLYVLIVAPTTYYRKTTTLRALDDLVRAVCPHLLLASQHTPEVLFSKLAGKTATNYSDLSPYDRKIEDQGLQFAAQRGIITDEATRLFSNKKYMDGMPEAFMEFYDGRKRVERELKAEGKLVIAEPTLLVFGATTPARLKLNLIESEWEDGLLARFELLTPPEKIIRRSPSHMADDDSLEPPAALKARLLKLYHALPEPPLKGALIDDQEPSGLNRRDVMMNSEALQAFNAYSDALHDMCAPTFGLDERVRGNYGRLSVVALKVAMIYSALDWNDTGAEGVPLISLGHWARAQQFTEHCRESLHRLLTELSKSEDIKNEEKIIDHIRLVGADLPTRREIVVATGNKKRNDIHAAIDALLEAGVIEEFERTTRGHKTFVYGLTEDYI